MSTKADDLFEISYLLICCNFSLKDVVYSIYVLISESGNILLKLQIIDELDIVS